MTTYQEPVYQYRVMRAIKQLEDYAKQFGFKVSVSAHDYQSLCLMPDGEVNEGSDKLPCYSRDAQFGYNGTVEGLTAFLIGWEKSLEYLKAMGITNPSKIEKKEEEYRHNRLARVIKEGKVNDSQSP
jgi:hypothetical protein